MPTNPTKHYKAFISYSHDNEEFGAWLHKQLERYKIPKRLREDYPHLPKTLYPIFRDRYELNAGDDLGVEISKALEKILMFLLWSVLPNRLVLCGLIGRLWSLR